MKRESDNTGPESSPDQLQAVVLQFGPFRTTHRIGEGGFADVYFARDERQGRPVALKVLREGLDESLREQIRARFLAEGHIARAIEDRHVIDVYEVGDGSDATSYIAMEYVEGLPFDRYFAQRRASSGWRDLLEGQDAVLVELARLGQQVARAMARAHELGVVHRDLKPDNVLVRWPEPGGLPEVTVLDFGIAKAPTRLFPVAEGKAFTRYFTDLGTVMGSPPYMAPEQNGAAHGVSGKADVFALGVMLLMIACELGGEGLTPESAWEFPEDLERALAQRPSLAQPWARLLRSMLALEPADRPPMLEVARKLQRLAQANEPFALAVETWLATGRLPRAHRLVEMLAWAEGEPHLTEDELVFLKRAPLHKLRGFRVAAWLGAAVAALTLASVGLAWALALRETRLEEIRAEKAAAETRHEQDVAQLSAQQRREQLRLEKSAAERRAEAETLESSLEGTLERLERSQASSAEGATLARALRRDLDAQRRASQSALQRIDVLQRQLATRERAVDEARRAASDAQERALSKAAESELYATQLQEARARLELCARRSDGRQPIDTARAVPPSPGAESAGGTEITPTPTQSPAAVPPP